MDRYGYDAYGEQPQPRTVGYDEYGRPVHEQAQPGADPYRTGYDPYAPQPHHGDAYPADGPYPSTGPYAPADPYAPSGPYGAPDPYAPADPYGGAGSYPAADPYAPAGSYPPADPYAPAGGYPAAQPSPQQTDPGDGWYPQDPAASRQDAGAAGTASGSVPRQRREPEEEYRGEEFAFVEEPADSSEDVIDWLKFTESRTERREEARRRGRSRLTALAVVLVLVAAGGVGWAWYAGKLPGVGGAGASAGASAAGKQHDVIVVHLRSTEDGSSSTALLVDNSRAGSGTTLLLPNSLAVATDDGGTTTLARSVEDEGAAPTREGLGELLGADIKGTWRLDTPYLETLVEMSGGIEVDANTTVPAAKKGDDPQVRQGRGQTLDGREAVAYATYRGPGERQSAQLERFGEVMRQTLRKLSTDPDATTRTVKALGLVPDPSLSEAELGASLAKLAERAKGNAYRTTSLPVRANGTLGAGAGESVVKKVLGGTVRNSDPDGVLRVELTDATGTRGRAASAEAALVNSGCTVVDGPSGTARAQSRITYAKAGQRAKATEVATTLGLPASAVQRASGGAEPDDAGVSVLLGRDYEG